MRFRSSIFLCAAVAFLAGSVALSTSKAAAPRIFTQEAIPASPTVDTKRPATIEAVRFGFDGYMMSDAWSPIRVYLSGNPAINTGAFAGTITVEFAQDATQSARITANFATTPGRVTPVEIIAAIPRSTPTIRVQLHDQSGRLVNERTYWRAQFGETPLPAEILDDVQLVVVVADKSGAEPSIARALRAPEAIVDRRDLPAEERTSTPTIDERLAYCVVRDEDLPTSEYGFAGVAVVAARSDVVAGLPTAKAAALAAWVQSGGCLVVLAGADPQAWLRHFWSQPPIEILEPGSVLPDPGLVSGAGGSDSAKALNARVVRLTQPIAESGWRIDWGTIKSVRHDGEPLDGLLAQGPAGFGWIVVLGIDPALLGTTSAQLGQNWNLALRHALAEASTRPRLGYEERWRGSGSGTDEAARGAIKASLDRMADIPALGDGAFIAIAAFLLLLAVAIGPFDAILLQRARLRAWSWATALGWIAIASLLAAVVPPLIRSGTSTSHRLRVVDVVQSSGGSVQPQQTALTSLFANASSSVTVFDPNRGNEPPLGWFRGISASYMDETGRSQPLASFATVQSEIRVDGELPERINSPSPRSPMAMGQWTLRSFMSTDSGQPAAAPSVQLSRSGGTWNVKATGLTGTKAEGFLRVGTDRLQLESRPTSLSLAGIEFLGKAQPGTDQRWDERFRRSSDHDVSFDSTFSPGTLLELPGTRDRSRAVDALLASGGWACVYLLETGGPSSLGARAIGSNDNFAATESTLWRILVPLATDDRLRTMPLPVATVSTPTAPAKKAAP
jgi:hypothetical protein